MQGCLQQGEFFLSNPPIIYLPTTGAIFFLYFFISDNATISLLVKGFESEEKPIYFISKVFRGAELRYQKIESLSLAVVTMARKLRPYCQSQ